MGYIADPLARRVIGLAINVHRALGPGLHEAPYGLCLEAELDDAGVKYERQRPIELRYRGRILPCVYRIDLVVEGRLLLEVKAVERLTPVHNAQILTYLKLSGLTQGLLINFNVTKLVDGIRSFVNGLSLSVDLEKPSMGESSIREYGP